MVLGAAPQFIITRNLGKTEDWIVFHSGNGAMGGTIFNSTYAYNSFPLQLIIQG